MKNKKEISFQSRMVACAVLGLIWVGPGEGQLQRIFFPLANGPSDALCPILWKMSSVNLELSL